MQTQIDAGWRITTLIKPIIGLYYGLPGGKQWRRFLSTEVVRASDPVKMIQDYDHA
jgi:hypothetical protein